MIYLFTFRQKSFNRNKSNCEHCCFSMGFKWLLGMFLIVYPVVEKKLWTFYLNVVCHLLALFSKTLLELLRSVAWIFLAFWAFSNCSINRLTMTSSWHGERFIAIPWYDKNIAFGSRHRASASGQIFKNPSHFFVMIGNWLANNSRVVAILTYTFYLINSFSKAGSPKNRQNTPKKTRWGMD